jgi:poly-gamma-glutamate synthesis protein (capsule biosynthesis protein)
VFSKRRASLLLCLALAVLAAGCSSSDGTLPSGAAASPGGGSEEPAGSTGSTDGADPATPKPSAKSGKVRIAFGGDVHFAGSSASALNGNVGSATSVLKSADLAVVNLETAITDRGTAAPKEFTFRAPPSGLTALRKSGVDVVTLANNHGMDYGRVGLADTLKAAKRSGLHLIGAGNDVTEAFTPYRKTIHGVRISVLGATDVLDAFATTTWPATETESGLASAKDTDTLVDAVKTTAKDSDIVVVVLHWGVETKSCPSDRQRTLAKQLTKAGADVVVGSHAHVLGPHITKGKKTVHYGLGNFVFYARGGPASQSGVYSVVVDRDGVLDTKWSPAQIEGGRPRLLSGSAAEQASSREDALAGTCGLS